MVQDSKEFWTICMCCIDLLDNIFDAKQNGNIFEYFNNATFIGKGSFLKNRHIFHYTIMHNILNDLICKTDLISIKVDVNGLVTCCPCCRRFGRKTLAVVWGCGRSREGRLPLGRHPSIECSKSLACGAKRG